MATSINTCFYFHREEEMISVELVQKGDRLRVRNRADKSGWSLCISIGEAGREDTSGCCSTGGTVHSR